MEKNRHHMYVISEVDFNITHTHMHSTEVSGFTRFYMSLGLLKEELLYSVTIETTTLFFLTLCVLLLSREDTYITLRQLFLFGSLIQWLSNLYYLCNLYDNN